MLAITSLPVPLSPVMMTLLSLRLTTFTKSKIARIRGLCPTTTWSIENCVGALMMASRLGEWLNDLQLFKLLDLFPQRHLDAHVERHVRTWATRTHPGQAHHGVVAAHVDELDVAAVGLHQRPDPIEHCLNSFLRNHVRLASE